MSKNSTHIGDSKKFLVSWRQQFAYDRKIIRSIVCEKEADNISHQVNEKHQSIKVETEEETYYVPHDWYRTMVQVPDNNKSDA